MELNKEKGKRFNCSAIAHSKEVYRTTDTAKLEYHVEIMYNLPLKVLSFAVNACIDSLPSYTHLYMHADGGRDKMSGKCQTNVPSVQTPPALCTTF